MQSVQSAPMVADSARKGQRSRRMMRSQMDPAPLPLFGFARFLFTSRTELHQVLPQGGYGAAARGARRAGARQRGGSAAQRSKCVMAARCTRLWLAQREVCTAPALHIRFASLGQAAWGRQPGAGSLGAPSPAPSREPPSPRCTSRMQCTYRQAGRQASPSDWSAALNR